MSIKSFEIILYARLRNTKFRNSRFRKKFEPNGFASLWEEAVFNMKLALIYPISGPWCNFRDAVTKTTREILILAAISCFHRGITKHHFMSFHANITREIFWFA